MKKIISVLLAVCMVFSMTVMAAPMQVSTVQSAQETVADEGSTDAGDLFAANKNYVKPGLNILTGDTSVLSFDKMTIDQFKALFTYSGGTTIEITDYPGEQGNKALKWTYQTYADHAQQPATDQAYPEMALDLGSHIANLTGHTYIHVKHKAAKIVDLPEGAKYTNANTLWVMHTSGNADNVVTHSNVEKNSGWVTKDALLDFSKYNGAGDKPTNSNTIQKLRFQSAVYKSNSVDTVYYLDDIAFIPAYRFNYYSVDGTTLLKQEYKACDENGNVITSFSPKAGLFGDYYVPAWSTSVGGSPVDTIQLANENVNFYATDYYPAVTIKSEGNLTDKDSSITLTPVIASALKDVLTASKGVWTIDDQNVATIVTNKNGSATITAVNEGTAKATYTVSGVSAEYTVNVAFPYNVDIESMENGFDINTAGYTAMVVKTKGNAESKLFISVDNDTPFDVTIKGNADGSARDNYFDLSILEGWVEGTNVAMAVDGDAEVESIKFYGAFDPSFDIEIKVPSTYLSLPAEEINVIAQFNSALAGVYDEGCTWTVSDPDDVASYMVNNDGTLLVRSKIGNGIVTVTATSTEDETYSVSKEILVNVSNDNYGMYHDFLEATTPADVNLRQCGGDGGNTRLTVVNGKLHIERPVSTSDNGGIEYLTAESTKGNQTWLVIKADKGTNFSKLYYKYDTTGFDETKTTYASSAALANNDDGTVLWYIPMSKVPETANLITGLMIQFANPTDGYIHCFYTTSIAPTQAQSKVIGHTWDMKTNTFSAGSGHHFLSTANKEEGTITVTQAHAVLGSGSSKQVKGTAAKLSDGTSIWKLEANSGGSVDPIGYPAITLNDYPYMWIKYKATGSSYADLYIRDQDQGGATSGYDNMKINLPASEDYTTLVVYLPDAGYKASMNSNLNYIMFAYRGTTYLDDVKYDEAGKFYYVTNPPTIKSSTSITIDEVSFANYDPTEEVEIPLNIGITLSADKDAITEDGGSVTITPTVFANQPISTESVSWSLVSGNAKFTANDDGTLTITALGNGDVVIKATASEDSSFSTTITIPVSGQRNKVASYEFTYYALGNSYLEHGPFNNGKGWPWPDAEKGNRGMAASTYEKDYYHRVQHYLTTGFNATLTAFRQNYAGLERAANYNKDDANPITTYEQAVAAVKANSQYTTIKNNLINKKPNIITVQLSENFGSPYNNDVTRAFYDTVYGLIDEYRPAASVVVVMLPFQTGTRPNIIREYATKYGFYLADMTDVPSYSVVDPERRYFVKDGVTYDRGNDSWKYNPYLAFEQYPEYDEIRQKQKEETGTAPAEFRTHPGDMGMDLIGQRMFEQFEKAVPAFLEAEYIYIPTSLTIAGENTITAKNGTLALTVEAPESDASTDVIWSVDNTNIATIDKNGVLTAVNNGTVTVKAVCAYNSEIVATKVITVSGQDDAFILSYKAGTTDEVTGLPSSDRFAKGEYVLSTAVPERMGYKFLGWSLEQDGAVVTEINVTKDTDVYAVWTLAENWQFNNDGNTEGVVFSGFNVAVQNGQGSVLSYGDGVSVSNNALKLDSDMFNAFNAKMTLTGSSDNEATVTLVINTTEGNKTYTKNFTTLGTLDTYSFDISDAEGTITGFSLVPSAKECTFVIDWIEFERTALGENVKVDEIHVINNTSVNLNGYKYEINVLDASADISFANGTVIIGEIKGNGNVDTTGVNLVYTGTELDGYVQFNIGEKTAEENLLFAEIDGCQYRFDGTTYGMIVPEGETKLVQVVEKTSEKALTTVASRYFKVTRNGATALTMFENSIDNDEEVSLRVKDPVGVRFKAGILNTAKADASVKEFGFVIALEKDLVNAGKQLNLDFNKIATGSAYISGTDTDIIFKNDGTTSFFTGVLYGIPEDSYGIKLVSKTFMKLDIDGEEFVVYGEPITVSAYEIAKSLENDDDLTPEAKAIVDNIIDKAENGNDLGFDYDDIL